MGEFGRAVTIASGEAIAGIMAIGDAGITVFQKQTWWQNLKDFGSAAVQMGLNLGVPTELLGKMAGAYAETGEAAKQAADAQAKTPPVDYAARLREAEAAEKAAEEATKKHAKAVEDAAKELAEWAAGYERISAAGTDWHEQVSRHDEQLVSHIQSLLQAGRSVEELAKAFSLAKEDVAAMKRELDENTAALDRHDAAARETASLIERHSNLQTSAVVRRPMPPSPTLICGRTNTKRG